MATFDEELVTEWLTRQGYFTIRGVRAGNQELDLLACRPSDDTAPFLHVEVNVSFNPVGYMCRGNARRLPDHELKDAVSGWVENKFGSAGVKACRERIIPGATWEYWLVHGVINHDFERLALESCGLRLISYRDVLLSLRDDPVGSTSTFASHIGKLLRYINQ